MQINCIIYNLFLHTTAIHDASGIPRGYRTGRGFVYPDHPNHFVSKEFRVSQSPSWSGAKWLLALLVCVPAAIGIGVLAVMLFKTKPSVAQPQPLWKPQQQAVPQAQQQQQPPSVQSQQTVQQKAAVQVQATVTAPSPASSAPMPLPASGSGSQQPTPAPPQSPASPTPSGTATNASPTPAPPIGSSHKTTEVESDEEAADVIAEADEEGKGEKPVITQASLPSVVASAEPGTPQDERQNLLRQASLVRYAEPVVIAVDSVDELRKYIDQDRPVLVDCWANWCGPCRASSPHLDAYAADGHLVVKIDIDRNPTLFQWLCQQQFFYNDRQVTSTGIPAFFTFRSGELKFRYHSRINSAQDASNLASFAQ